jgi:hypothetical protein
MQKRNLPRVANKSRVDKNTPIIPTNHKDLKSIAGKVCISIKWHNPALNPLTISIQGKLSKGTKSRCRIEET